MNLIQQLEQEEIARLGKTIPEFAPGDTVVVHVRVVEGNRSRLQAYEGVVISRRNRGLKDQAVIQAQPPKCENVVSTVGAGDSMVAGLIYGIEKGLSQADTLAFASAVSAFAVSQSNVGVSDTALLEPILANVKISVIEG